MKTYCSIDHNLMDVLSKHKYVFKAKSKWLSELSGYKHIILIGCDTRDEAFDCYRAGYNNPDLIYKDWKYVGSKADSLAFAKRLTDCTWTYRERGEGDDFKDLF